MFDAGNTLCNDGDRRNTMETHAGRVKSVLDDCSWLDN